MTSAGVSNNRTSTGRAVWWAARAGAALALCSFWLAAPAEAKVPPFAASCPGRVEVQADPGGRIFINGLPARLKSLGERGYEARQDGVRVSIFVGPGGRLNVSSAVRGMGDAVCRVRAPHMEPRHDGPGNRADEPRAGLPPVDRMVAVCRAEVAQRFHARRSDIVTDMPFRDGRRFVVPGRFRDRGRSAAFACAFDASGRLLSVK